MLCQVVKRPAVARAQGEANAFPHAGLLHDSRGHLGPHSIGAAVSERHCADAPHSYRLANGFRAVTQDRAFGRAGQKPAIGHRQAAHLAIDLVFPKFLAGRGFEGPHRIVASDDHRPAGHDQLVRSTESCLPLRLDRPLDPRSKVVSVYVRRAGSEDRVTFNGRTERAGHLSKLLARRGVEHNQTVFRVRRIGSKLGIEVQAVVSLPPDQKVLDKDVPATSPAIDPTTRCAAVVLHFASTTVESGRHVPARRHE